MSSDVTELILSDHRHFEDLFRGLRERNSNRSDLLGELSEVLVAHANAEEKEVYPALRRFRKVDKEERTILNDAREAVSDKRRAELGELFAGTRSEQLDAHCGRVDRVRELVRRTENRVD